MLPKIKDKQRAVTLRRLGYSYSEILSTISVAKSTLSLWLRSVGLSKQQKQTLTKKRLEASRRGAQKKKEQRIAITKHIQEKAIKDIKKITRKDLWLMGIMLYWAEGSKQKSYNPSVMVQFANSDAYMIKLFLKWLLEICQIKKHNIKFEIYVHYNKKSQIRHIVDYWSQIVGFPKAYFRNIYFKKHTIKEYRKNTGNDYYGLIRVQVRASTNLNRKIAGWVEGVKKYYWGVV